MSNKRKLSSSKTKEKLNESAPQNMSIEEQFSEDEDGGTRIGDIYIPPPIQPQCFVQKKGPRLIITKIENENFKSYAGKVVLGPFHHCFTAIIGPNGSGKSNVIDSMLFVFGYRAQKIRCKKLSVLLHNSAKFPDMQMCSVAIHFKLILDTAGDSYEEVENSEIVIARTAFKDNSSFYTVNGKKVQFKEVSKILKNNGIDLDHNRFLILQGEVESIAMMKAKGQTENECGMLEYLEDIIGTTRYKEPLTKINLQVESLTEERTEKHNRCKLAEREMKDLEQPHNEAIEYLKLENTMTRTKNLQIQKYMTEQNKKLQEYSVENDFISKELQDHDLNFSEMKKERLEKEAIIMEDAKNYEKLCKNKEDMENKLKTALNNFTETQTTMTVTNKRRKLNKTQLIKHEEKLLELNKLPEKNEKEILECEQKVDKLNTQKLNLENELQKNYAQLEEQTKPLIEDREKLETKLIEVKKLEDDSKAELTVAEQELKILKHDETTETRKYEAMKTSFVDSNNNLNDNKCNVSELKNEIPKLKQKIATKTEEIQKSKTEEQAIRSKMLYLKAEISEKQRSIKSTRSNNKVLDSLMRQKQEGNINGILGRLGDLGAINAKYDVAISTACGRLDNIIVDTVNTAQACIEYLKKHDVGRASFVALEKVQHLRRYCESRIDTPENVPRLFDLVTVEDQRVLPAFYFALRNTLVGENLDQGTRIAYGATRFRVVTLQGDVIETSGTMSGGGRTQMRGRMGDKVATKTSTSNLNSSVVSQKAIEHLQEQAENMQSQINFCQQTQGELEKELNELKHTLQFKEKEINKLIITVQSLGEQLPRIEKQLESQKKRMEKTITDPVKLQNLESKIVLKQDEFKISEKATIKLTSKIADITKKITDIHGDKVKSVQQKIKNLTKQITSLNENIAKLKVQISSSERSYKKIEQEIEDLKNEIKNAEDQIKILNEKRIEYDEEGVTWAKKIDDAKEEMENGRTTNTQVQKEILEIQKKEMEENLKRIEIEQKLQTLQKKITDVKSQLPHWQNKLKPLKLHEIPGDVEQQEPLKTYTEDELNSYKLQDLQYQYNAQEEKLNSKTPNLSVIQEYTNKREVYLKRVHILEDITTKRNEMRQLYDDVRKKRYTEFVKGFYIITRKLKEMYQMITQGGDAELELVDSMDPFTEGVTFSVRPPKKTWKNISNLSGGEKTLSSLALVFALHYYKPSPLYFMDEIDAALDFKNISIVAHYIKERTKNAQFIIISLRTNMFELSDYIVGIYKVCDCTSTITIKNEPPKFLNNSQENNNSKVSDIITDFDLLQAETENDTITNPNKSCPNEILTNSQQNGTTTTSDTLSDFQKVPIANSTVVNSLSTVAME